MQDEDQPLDGTTVLLAEDDGAVRRVASRALTRSGCSVIAVESGAEALRLAKEHPGPIELLLTDIMMPGMNGVEVAARIMKLRPRIRVLYMSGYADQELVRRGLLDPETHFLQKPFSPQELARRIEGIVLGEKG